MREQKNAYLTGWACSLVLEIIENEAKQAKMILVWASKWRQGWAIKSEVLNLYLECADEPLWVHKQKTELT